MRETLDDTELVARSRRRDAEAFGALVERHQRLVFGVALARCGDTALAEDVAQEAFVAAWRDLDRLRDSARIGPWVAGIARNLASTAARSEARPRELPEGDAVPSPEDEALEREDRELLQRALAEVPDAHREALVLYYLDGEPIAQIALALGIREDLVKQRLSRGRKALRDSVAARVESALTRRRPGLRAGVIAALGAGTAREAAAGRLITIMSTKKIAVGVALVLALGGTAAWVGTRARAGSPAPSPEAPAPSSPSASAPHVRKLADPASRAPLLAAIRERAEVRRKSTTSSATPSSGSGPRPVLPADPSLTTSYIRGAVKELVPLLMECYEQGMERDVERASGLVMVKFRIEGEPELGGVISDSQVETEGTTVADPQVRECVQETMYGLQIDPPEAGGSVVVRHQLRFSAGVEPPKAP